MLQNKSREQSACSSVSMDHDVTKHSREQSACSFVSMDHDVTKQINRTVSM